MADLPKPRRIGGDILIGLVAITLVGAAGAKLAHAPFLVAQLRSFGFSDSWMSMLGVIELASAVLFAIPRTRALGLLLITGFLGGAVATHIQHGQSPVQPAVLLALGWIGVRLRNPNANWSRTAGSPAAVSSHGTPSQAQNPRRESAALWLGRAVLALVTGILVLISARFLLDPAGASAERGIILSTAIGRTIARVGFGAFPLASAVVVAACLAAPSRVRYGLWVVVALFGTVLFVRLAGAVADDTLRASVPLIVPEVIFSSLAAVALVMGRRRGCHIEGAVRSGR